MRRAITISLTSLVLALPVVGTAAAATKTKVVIRKFSGATYQVGRSGYISENAIPILKSEALRAQSANIDLVSGATDLSEAFINSLQSAILKAKRA
jgi:hypothetical protein